MLAVGRFIRRILEMAIVLIIAVVLLLVIEDWAKASPYETPRGVCSSDDIDLEFPIGVPSDVQVKIVAKAMEYCQNRTDAHFCLATVKWVDAKKSFWIGCKEPIIKKLPTNDPGVKA